jgi:hypothetical protein
MINVPFGMHLALHVLVETLAMAYISFKTCFAIAMVYILVIMHPTLHVPFKALAMIYMFEIKMCLASHVLFETLVMASILVKMRVAPCVPFKTLAMAYFLI